MGAKPGTILKESVLTDIVERLREYADQLGAAYPQCDGEMLAEDAAAEIERLREIEKAVKALVEVTTDEEQAQAYAFIARALGYA